jgi:hypothetical protein
LTLNSLGQRQALLNWLKWRLAQRAHQLQWQQVLRVQALA